nr:PREDICTED: 3-oxo-5-alpha-steroid 4-dehydrogenase 1 [Apteryx mantelli mantelli]
MTVAVNLEPSHWPAGTPDRIALGLGERPRPLALIGPLLRWAWRRRRMNEGAGARALLLCFIPMPYGRYSSRRFGWLLPARPNGVLLGLFVVHYAHRALIFPLLIREGKPTPFFTFVLALLFCVYNGYLQGRSLSNYAKYPSTWLKEPFFIAGFLGWLIGMTINIHSDHILRNLRKPGETGYMIPRGGMFEYVTGANFFGEILEWFGFALACCTIQSLAFALCTLFILGSRAKQHHQWYLEKFEDYPKSRKILIPFVF